MEKIEQSCFSTRRRLLHKDVCLSHKNSADVKNLYYKFRDPAATSQPRRLDASIFADMLPQLNIIDLRSSKSDGMYEGKK